MDSVAIEVAHWAAVLPAALVVVLWVRDEWPPWPYRIVAAAFAVSAVADWVRSVTGVPFVAQPYYPAVQFGLFALAVSIGRPWLQDTVVFVAVCAITVSAFLLVGPDIWVRVVGAIVVLALAKDHPLGWTLFVYCGIATALYLRMLWEGADVGAARPWWYAYQSARLVSFALFGRAVWRTA